MSDGWEDAPKSSATGWEDAPSKAQDNLAPVRSFANIFGPQEAMASMASGAISTPLSGISGLAGALLPGPPGQGADWQQRVQDATTYQPRTEAGRQTMAIVSKPGEWLAHGADALGECLEVPHTGLLSMALFSPYQRH